LGSRVEGSGGEASTRVQEEEVAARVGLVHRAALARRRRRKVQRFRGGLVFKAHRLLYHSTLGLRVIKKKKSRRKLVARRGPETSFAVHSPFLTGADRMDAQGSCWSDASIEDELPLPREEGAT